MRTPSPPPLRPAPLSFEQRRWTVVFALPFAALMALGGPAMLLWLPSLLGAKLGIPLGIFFALASLALAGGIGGPALKALRQKGPALVIDARGITDNFHLNKHLPWQVIESACVDLGDGDTLVIVLRPGARLPGGAMVRAQFWRRLFSGGDLSIPLGGLVCNHHRLREVLQAHLACQASDKAR